MGRLNEGMTMTNKCETADWAGAVPHLQCPTCDHHDLSLGPHAKIVCRGCGRDFPLRDGLCLVQEQHTGNNGVAAEFYNSSRWDKYRFWKRFTPFNHRAVTRWSEEVFAMLPDLSGTRILDIAIGDGRNMPFVPDDCEIFGIDISVAQLDACQRAHADRKLWLMQGEAESLPFRDNTFDRVLSFGAFNYFNDPLVHCRRCRGS